MAIHDSSLEDYLETLATPADPILQRAGDAGRRRGFPIVGPQVGRFLEQIARLLQARRIFELGSGFGYSTLWFARALPSDGVIHHTDGDPKNSEEAKRHLAEAGLEDRVRFHVGDAREILSELEDEGPFDIVFCDIDKDGYPDALPLMCERVRVGGAIIIDNLIWSGAVADPSNQEPSTQGIRAYTQAMWSDPDYLSSLLPIRDGVGFHVRLR